MRPISQKLRKELEHRADMKRCIHNGCPEKPEWEHAWTYGGRQINEQWAIVPVCEYHHRGVGLNKEYNQYMSLKRATEYDLKKYPRVNWRLIRGYLDSKFETVV